jgi:SSS family solute:Na+ symporter
MVASVTAILACLLASKAAALEPTASASDQSGAAAGASASESLAGSGGEALATTTPTAGEGGAKESLSALDWSVIGVYGCVVVAIGAYYARRTKNAEDYHLGGRTMSPLMVGVSLFATLLSTLSFLAYPGETIRHGLMILAVIPGLLLVAIVVGWFLIPHIMRLRVTTAYEILESRFHVSVRLLGSLMFLSLRVMWMATIVYVVTDKVLAPILNVDPSWSPSIAALLASLALASTMLGGLRAAVAIDVAQTTILFAGAILTLMHITWRLGGVSAWIPVAWPAHWQPPEWGFAPGERLSFAGLLTSTVVWYVCTAGSDQLAIQRYLATRDVRSARKVLIVSVTADAAVTLLLITLGVVLLAYYTRHPQSLPDGLTLVEGADKLFAHYIVHGLPPGITGLVVAALFADAMSTLSSGVNSTGSVVAVDLIRRLRGRSGAERSELRLARWSSMAVGVIVVCLSLFIGRAPGNIYEMTYRTVNLFVAPMFLLFFMAMFIPWATSLGAWAAALTGLAVAVTIAFWESYKGSPGISFLWITPGAFACGAVAGCLVSLLPITKSKPLAINHLGGLADDRA